MKYINYLKFWFQLIIEKAKIKGPAKCSFKIYKIMSFQFHFDFTIVFGEDSSSPTTGEYIKTEMNVKMGSL
jgi:hypothetical protein